MGFLDQLNHSAEVTKWKADQQIRLAKASNQIREIENLIKAQKVTLANATFSLFSQGKITENELTEICQTISIFYAKIAEQQHLQEEIRNERPPQKPENPVYPKPEPSPVVFSTPEPTPSGLVCPICNKSLVGRFCPIHGVEGIAPITPLTEENEANGANEANRIETLPDSSSEHPE